MFAAVDFCEELEVVELFGAVLFEEVEFVGVEVFVELLLLVLLLLEPLLSSIDGLLFVPFLSVSTIAPVTVELSYFLLY